MISPDQDRRIPVAVWLTTALLLILAAVGSWPYGVLHAAAVGGLRSLDFRCVEAWPAPSINVGLYIHCNPIQPGFPRVI